MDSNLAYDVGVHNGNDTAYYLHKRFRVVGVEANPVMADRLRKRFASEILSGAFLLLEVGVAEREGELDFWICDDKTDWCSFNEKLAPARGLTSRPVKVRTVRFATILEQHGVPFYCKIDIEGNDHLCLEGIDASDKPKFVSVEMSHASGGRDLSILNALGYRKFKIISQVTRRPALPALQLALSYMPVMVRKNIKRVEKYGFGRLRESDWTFAPGSSGAFGDDLPGRWLDYKQTVAVWQTLHEIDARLHANGLGEWFDIHAAA
jgi:FkbM family methyltransferase